MVTVMVAPPAVTNDTSYALGNTLLLEQDEAFGLAGIAQMSATAELNTVLSPLSVLGVLQYRGNIFIGHRHNADRIGIGLTKYGAEGADLLSGLQRRDEGLDRNGALDLLLDDGLDGGKLLGGQSAAPREVESELVLVTKRSLLVDGLIGGITIALGHKNVLDGVVQHVRHGVVGSDGSATVVVDTAAHGVAHSYSTLGNLAKMKDVLPVGLHVGHRDGGPAGRPDGAGVIGLPTGLGIKAGLVQDHADGSALGGDGVHEANSILRLVPADEQSLGRAAAELLAQIVLGGIVRGGHVLPDEVGRLLGHEAHVLAAAAHHLGLVGGRAELLLLLHLGIERVAVQGKAELLGHELGEVDGEAHGGVQEVCVDAGEDLVVAALGRHVLEADEALVEGLGEGLLLVLDDGGNVRLVLAQLGEGVAHELDELGNERGEEAQVGAEVLAAVADGAAEDAAEDVPAAVVGGGGAVGDGEAEGADVVGHDAVGHVDVAVVLGADLSGVRPGAGDAADLVEEGDEDVGVVVGVDALQDGREALEAHAGVDVLGREGPEAAVGLAVELDEDVVPDLDDVGQVGVDAAGGVAAADAVVVDLRARPAGSRGAHLPEVVLGVEGQDAVGGEVVEPDVARLEVGGGRLVAAEVRGVQPRLVEAELLRQALPRHGDGPLLEVVPEGPVAQHLEEGVMVHVLADVVEVVVLAAGADALLRVGGAGQRRHLQVRVARAEEQRLVLVHPRIGKQEGGIVVRDDRGGRPEHVRVLLDEEVDEGGADPVHGPLQIRILLLAAVSVGDGHGGDSLDGSGGIGSIGHRCCFLGK